jgi:Zn-dependent protease with chaperone function
VDFYSRQHAARRQTRWLVIGFIIALTAVVLALDAVLFTLFASASADKIVLAPFEYAAFNPGTAFFTTLVVLAVIGLASLIKSLELRSGGAVVARSLGGVRVDRDTTDLKRKRLHNVIEEMAIASGVPVPEVYVLEQEAAINAFAAGHTPANAAVAVTQGALDRLNREQLQGVIAHEFSHVVNGDMRLNIQLMGWLFGLLIVALIGRTILRFAPRGGKKGGGGIALAALAIIVLGYIGLLAGRILQAAVSRQRERLADASAVQFTRNPGGLKEALLKIAGLAEGSRLTQADAEQVAHMLFAPGLKRLFATHPPIAERIHELDPSFNVRTLPRLAEQALQEDIGLDEALHATEVSAQAPALVAKPVAANAVEIAAQVGQVETIHIQQARALRLALPPVLRQFSASADTARVLVLTLLLSSNEVVRNRQLTRLANALRPDDLKAIQQCWLIAQALEPMLRLPALLQAFPPLRRLPKDERRALMDLVEELIRADSHIDLFEFCLAKLLETWLRDDLEARAPHGNFSVQQLRDELQTLFSVMAHAGAANEDQARMAFEIGISTALPERHPAFSMPADWPERLGKALPRLEKLRLVAKRAVIEGLVKTVAHDEVLNVAEAELLRTVCAILHCPLPPLLPATAY